MNQQRVPLAASQYINDTWSADFVTATLADGFFDVQACNDTNRLDLFVFAAAD